MTPGQFILCSVAASLISSQRWQGGGLRSNGASWVQVNRGGDRPGAGRGVLVSSPLGAVELRCAQPCRQQLQLGYGQLGWRPACILAEVPQHPESGGREATRVLGCRLACAGESRHGRRERDGEWLRRAFEKLGCLLRFGRALGLSGRVGDTRLPTVLRVVCALPKRLLSKITPKRMLRLPGAACQQGQMLLSIPLVPASGRADGLGQSCCSFSPRGMAGGSRFCLQPPSHAGVTSCTVVIRAPIPAHRAAVCSTCSPAESPVWGQGEVLPRC